MATDAELIELFKRQLISTETLLKHFGISSSDLENKEKSAEKIEENDFMFLDID